MMILRINNKKNFRHFPNVDARKNHEQKSLIMLFLHTIESDTGSQALRIDPFIIQHNL